MSPGTTAKEGGLGQLLASTLSTADLPNVLSLLVTISQQMEGWMTNVNRKLTDMQRKITTVERLMQDGQTQSDRPTVGELASATVTGGDILSEDQRQLLRRCPLVSSNEEWTELEAELMDSGHDGAFFLVLVQTIKDRIMTKSDVHKTANATLRALFAESFLAERVTMAGYKKGKKN
jgi:hypothetical protein